MPAKMRAPKCVHGLVTLRSLETDRWGVCRDAGEEVEGVLKAAAAEMLAGFRPEGQGEKGTSAGG